MSRHACPAGDRCGTSTGASRWGGSKAGCERCRAAARRYNKRQQYLRTTRGPAYVDATPAREHLRSLLNQGGGAGTRAPKAGSHWFFPPAKTLGLSANQLRRIMSGDIQRIWPSTLDKILSLSLDDHDTAGELRDRAAFTGLVAALVDKGWTRKAIAAALVDLGVARADATTGVGGLQQRSAKVRRGRLDALRQMLAAARPPVCYVTPPFGGWDAWWNHQPTHPGRQHHTRRGCWRRGCRNSECVDAKRLYQRALAEGVDAVAAEVTDAVERQRLRERDRTRQQVYRQADGAEAA